MRLAHLHTYGTLKIGLTGMRTDIIPITVKTIERWTLNCDIDQARSIEDPECLEQRDSSSAKNVPLLFRPTRKSKRHAEQMLMMVNAIETRRTKRVKEKSDRMPPYFTSFFVYLDYKFLLKI